MSNFEDELDCGNAGDPSKTVVASENTLASSENCAYSRVGQPTIYQFDTNFFLYGSKRDCARAIKEEDTSMLKKETARLVSRGNSTILSFFNCWMDDAAIAKEVQAVQKTLTS